MQVFRHVCSGSDLKVPQKVVFRLAFYVKLVMVELPPCLLIVFWPYVRYTYLLNWGWVHWIYLLRTWFQALIASSFAKLDYEKVEEVTFYVLKVAALTKLFYC
jgi:hypothetical protein